MDGLSGPSTVSCFVVVKKKRSNLNRRPHPDLKTISNYLKLFIEPSSLTDCGGHEAVNLHCSNGNARMGEHNRSDANKQCGSDGLGKENKLTKVKLKLGGITHTLHTKPTKEAELGSRSHDIRSFGSSDVYGAHLKKDFSRNSAPDAKHKISRRYMDQVSDAVYKMGPKSKRASKKVYVDEEFDDEDDEEIRYLKKLRASKAAAGCLEKSKGIVNHLNPDYDDTKKGKKSRLDRKDNDYEMELSSDDELKNNRKRLTIDCVDPTEREMTMTTRKRALECPEFSGLVEFPNGLPSAPSKKQKLSEVEQQLRKAEVAQRRRLQAEKAAKEAEAEAIRKILGQDSSRKKEEKLKKQQKELAEERNGKAVALGPNTIRWIMGSHGTVVTFSEDMGLPKILDSVPCRYPPPREKCVGPNCTNDYKYRDSKSKLPLCSLHCYKAVRGSIEPLPAC